jgi:hypothetical protein
MTQNETGFFLLEEKEAGHFHSFVQKGYRGVMKIIMKFLLG